MAKFSLKIFGIEIGIGGIEDYDVYIRSMTKLTHSEVGNPSVTSEEIDSIYVSSSLISDGIITEGEIEPYE